MPVRVVLDAMGGDHALRVPVEGALWALREIPELYVILVGQEERIRAELARHSTKGLSIRHNENQEGFLSPSWTVSR